MVLIFGITLIIFLFPTIVFISSTEKRTGRLAYFFKSTFLGIIGWICLYIIMVDMPGVHGVDESVIMEAFSNEEASQDAWSLLFLITLFGSIQTCWMIHRLNDMNSSRWWVILNLVSTGLYVMLLLTPEKKVTVDYAERFT